MDQTALDWRRSRYCETNCCVEVARTDDSVFMRNSSSPDGPILTFTHAEWAAFVRGIKDEES
jgi:hypothetical protein